MDSSCECDVTDCWTNYHGYSGWPSKDGYSGYCGYCTTPPQKKSFMTDILKIGKTMKDDVKNFIIENRKIIYWLAILLILDQWVFDGKFREKLHELFETLINRVKKFFEAEA